MRHLPFPASLALSAVVLALAAGPATAQPELGSTQDVASAVQPTLSASSVAGGRSDFATTFRLSAGAGFFKRGKYARALRMWQPLADQGLPEAQYNIGLMHSAGLGVTKDEAEAKRWFRLAAAQGFAPARVYLSSASPRGGGVPPQANADKGSRVSSTNREDGVVQSPAPAVKVSAASSTSQSGGSVQPQAPVATGSDAVSTAVSLPEWREILSNAPTDDDNLSVLSTSYSNSGAALGPVD